MNQSIILEFTSRAMMLVLILSLPSIIVATFFGLIIALFQALTQIQEQTLGFAIKLIALTAVLILTAHWMAGELIQFTGGILRDFPQFSR